VNLNHIKTSYYFIKSRRLGGQVGRAFAPNAEGRGFVKSSTEKWTHVAFLVSVHHLRPETGLIGPVSV